MDTLTYVSRDTMSEIAEAIRSRNGKEDTYKPTQMAAAISALRKDSTEVVSDVVFRDYDGTVLYSYALEELAELTELPDLPSHDGLICQGWNWTLEKLQAFNKPITVGAKYITDDGTTRLNITIATTGRMDVPIYLSTTDTYNVYMDWGDGNTTTETPDASNTISATHTYAEPGDYTISITTDDENTVGLGWNPTDWGTCIMGS